MPSLLSDSGIFESTQLSRLDDAWMKYTKTEVSRDEFARACVSGFYYGLVCR